MAERRAEGEVAEEERDAQRMLHFPLFLRPLVDNRARRVAVSNTSRTPSPVRAEHSRYRVAPIF